MKKFIFALCLFVFVNNIFAQSYRTQALADDIGSIEVNAMGDWKRNSVMQLNNNEYIFITFDRLFENSNNPLRYNLIHCDADWKETKTISEIDYLEGFNNNRIDDYNQSVGTTVDYTHFYLEIPNRDVKPKISGNYVVQVYDEDNPQKILLTACFSVLEPLASIGYNLSTVTNIDANAQHQQVSIDVHHSLNIRDPHTDVKLFVYQNNRLDNVRSYLKPAMITAKKISYNNNLNLIFEAGNEYRRFETSSYRSNGYRVSHIVYNAPYYDMYVDKDRSLTNAVYRYDQDQNGRFMIRSSDTDNIDTEADYFPTTFTLMMPNPLPMDIYINGSFTNNTFDDRYKMTYDAENKEYNVTLLLKQGLYNYQYLTHSTKGYTPAHTEGNYFETENEYEARVYYRPTGQRYDQLIGVSTFYSRAK